MLKRLSALFRRYAATHLEIEGAGFPLSDETGRRIGNLDRTRLRGAWLEVTGWAEADRVSLCAGSARASVRPGLVRADVARDRGIAPEVGFELSILRTQTGSTQGAVLLVQAGTAPEDPLAFVIPMPASPGARFVLGLRFLAALARCLPAAVGWKVTRDPRHRARIKRLLGLVTTPEAGPIEARLLQPAPPDQALPVPDRPVTLILPVYNAFDLLAEALERVVSHTDLPWQMILIEDASPDPRVRPFLRDWAAGQEATHPGRITLIENAANLGFIGSVNAGLAEAVRRGGHAVLLNSDAFVPEGWLGRLMAPILTDPGVASVTPMSNDATIFSTPAIDRQTALEPGQADRIDAAARRLDPLRALAEVPTGMGFCMALNSAFLQRIPALDPVFGRGYGEEVDWCQKARALGGRHLGMGALYVEHRGGTSFGSAEKLRLVATNNDLIARRYPGYDAEVQDFLQADPLRAPRLALALAWAGAWAEGGPQDALQDGPQDEEDSGRAVPLYIAHTLGGGAEKYLEARIAADLAEDGRPAVVLRLGGQWRWQVELTGPWGRIAGASDDPELILRLLAPIRRRHVVYSCAVGHDDPLALPGLLLDLAGKGRTAGGAGGADVTKGRLEILFHDYFPLSPAYTLLDADGVYRGPLTPESMAVRPEGSQSLLRPRTPPVTLGQWRAAWTPALMAADSLVVFSEDSRRQVLASCPEAEARLVLRPHRLLQDVPRVTLAPPAPGRPARVIGVLGNIGAQKGAGVLVDLARQLAGRQDIGLVLLGNIDPDFTLPAHVRVHGDYAIAEIPALVARYGVTDWLIPSIWPETFSYTTHEALATGLPVMVFDLGAQGDAARGAPNGVVLPFDPAKGLAEAVIAAVETTAGPRAGHRDATQEGTAAP
jgi:O-antigen biosynthesis protein